jgi:hypothetical protein
MAAEGIITVLIKNILIPEIAAAIKRAREKKQGIEPTEEEVFQELESNIARGQELGRAFLARTGGDIT